MTNSTRNKFYRARRWGIAGAIGIAVAGIAVEAMAQQQLRQARNSSSVEVDWSVLDELDARAPVAAPSLMAPSSRNAPRRVPASSSTASQPSASAPAARTASAAPRQGSGAAPTFTAPPAPPAFSDTSPASRSTGSAPASPTPLTRPPSPPPAVATVPTAPAAAPAPAPSMAASAPPAPAPAPSMAASAPPPPPSAAVTAPPAPAPVPQAAPAPAPAPAPPQVAALPPPTVPVEGPVGRIDFAANASDLPANGRGILDKAASELKRDEGTRLQIVAYATGGDESGSQARRLSLSRALAVRSYLIDQGIRSTRMDVRALGSRSPDGPADRVDIVLVRR